MFVLSGTGPTDRIHRILGNNSIHCGIVTCNLIPSVYNRGMNKVKTVTELRLEALYRIERIAWDDNPDGEMLLQQIQATLYELSMICDNRTQEQFGDEEAHVNIPNMRRC